MKTMQNDQKLIVVAILVVGVLFLCWMFLRHKGIAQLHAGFKGAYVSLATSSR